jgi:glycosyltransferase involved in cell wall biosynthesis
LPVAARRPRVCLVQYNSSRFLSRVDRSARALGRSGWDVTLIAIKDADTPAREDRGDYTVRRVTLRSRRLPPWSRPLRYLEAVVKTFWAAYSADADVYNPRDLYPMLVCQLAARLRGAVVVADSDELNLYRNGTWMKQWWWRPVAKPYEGFFLRRAAACITSDEGRADVLTAEYGIARPTVVLNVSDVVEKVDPDPRLREQLLGGDSRWLLVYQGILSPNRGLPELVEAMKRLDDCVLLVLGDGPLRAELQAQAEGAGCAGRVVFKGAVPNAEMMRLVAACDAGVMPIIGACLSYVFAAPNKLFEDMMVGVPVVASDLPGMADIVRDEGIGTLIADPRDPGAIAAAVRRLLDDVEPPHVKGERARTAALARYNWPLEQAKLLAVYDRLREVRPPAVRGEKART